MAVLPWLLGGLLVAASGATAIETCPDLGASTRGARELPGLEELPSTPWGRDVTGKVRFKAYTVKGSRGEVYEFVTARELVTWHEHLGMFLFNLQGSSHCGPITAGVRTSFACPVVGGDVPREDYDGYPVVVELSQRFANSFIFRADTLLQYHVSLCGADSAAGDRRGMFAHDPADKTTLLLPLGYLPGTRIVVASGASVTIVAREGTTEKTYEIGPGGACDIRLGGRIRIEAPGTVIRSDPGEN